MNKKILIFICIGILIVGLGVVSYFFLIPRCPESCDDRNPCTQDSCSKQTNYQCSYTKLSGAQPGCLAEVTCGKESCKAGVCQIDYISNCCGNKICEVDETYPDCPADCPNCDDSNKCTADWYDYHQQKCVNKPMVDIVCCGNGVCETGETYENCAQDCPNCDDGNKCTKDYYDYHQKICVNKKISPCCGDGLCEKDETYFICPLDCSPIVFGKSYCDIGKVCTEEFTFRAEPGEEGWGGISLENKKDKKVVVDINFDIPGNIRGDLEEIKMGLRGTKELPFPECDESLSPHIYGALNNLPLEPDWFNIVCIKYKLSSEAKGGQYTIPVKLEIIGIK